MSTLGLIKGFFLIALFSISSLLSSLDLIDGALITTILTCILLFFWINHEMGHFLNTTALFMVFGSLYGILGSITAVWGEGLGSIFSRPYSTATYLIAFNLSNIGIISGIAIYHLLKGKNKQIDQDLRALVQVLYRKRKTLIITSILFASLGSLSEIINIFRIGGPLVLFTGKANVQSLVGSLRLTLPSSIFMNISFGLLGLSYGTRAAIYFKQKRIHIFLFIVAMLPYLFVIILLGQRGNIAALFLSLIIGKFFFTPKKVAKVRYLFFVFVIFIFSVFLVSARGLTPILLENPAEFAKITFTNERFLSYLNPGNTEFGASIGNFSEYHQKYGDAFSPRLGETYLKALVSIIPTYLYPGEKPKIITSEFRDEFFPALSRYGAIAGTGFSSILEAYLNFHYLGVWMVYFLLTILLQHFDWCLKHRNVFFNLIYISLFVFLFRFHRSSVADLFAPLLITLGLIFVSTLGLKIKLFPKSR